jgi:hypothetical protein
MALIIVIDMIVILTILYLAITKGCERALPFLAFCLIVLPQTAAIQLPGLFNLTVQRLAIIALAATYLFLGRKVKRRIPLGYLILFQAAWLLVAAANSPLLTISLKATLSQILDFFLLYYIVVRIVSNATTVHKVLGAIFAAMAVCSLLGYLEAYHNWSVMSYFPSDDRFTYLAGGPSGVRGTRVQATFPHAILFGAALSMTIPLGFYLLSHTPSAWRSVAIWVSIALMFMSIFKTGSRGAWMAALISLAGVFVFSGRGTRKAIVSIAFLSVFVLIVRPGVWDMVRDTYTATLDSNTLEGESYDWRYVLIQLAKDTVAHSVGRSLWGFGRGSFYDLHLTTKYNGKVVAAESCDSSVAELIIETGYLGLVSTFLVFIKAGTTAIKDILRLPKKERLLSVILLMSMLVFCFMMVNVAIYGWGQQNYMLWILIGISMIYNDLIRGQDPGLHVSGPLLEGEEQREFFLGDAGTDTPWFQPESPSLPVSRNVLALGCAQLGSGKQ